MTINSPMDVNLWSWEGQCDPVCWLLAQVEARSVSDSGLSPGQLDRVCSHLQRPWMEKQILPFWDKQSLDS